MTTKGVIGSIVGAFVGIVALTVLLGSWFTIDQGERGVILTNGAISGTAEPGLGWKTPWVDDLVTISVQSHKRSYPGEGGVFEAYSRDQQTATLRVSVLYRIPADQVAQVYQQYGGEEGVLLRLLDPHVFEKVKTVFGQFNAATAIQERGRLNTEITNSIQESVKGPLIIESVQVEDIAFDDSYEAAVRARMEAEVEVLKLKQNAEREKVQAEIVVTQAKAKADAVRAEAMAQAEAITLRGNAEATAINARGQALRNNPSLVSLVQAERWNGQLPTSMIPGGTIPFLNVGPSNQ